MTMDYSEWIGRLKKYLDAKKKGDESLEEALLLYNAIVGTSNDVHQRIVDKCKKVLEKEIDLSVVTKEKHV